MPDPEVIEALKRANLPTSGCVRLVHTTFEAAASQIVESSVLIGDDCSQAWLASSREIAQLHNSAGATRAEDAPLTEIDAIVEVEVDIDDLFFETTRESDGGDIEVFYLIDPGGGCRVTVISVEPWQRTRVTPASEPTPRQPPDNPSS